MGRTKYAPKGLDAAGRRLFREVTTQFPELTVGEELLLTEAARTADLCDKLHAESLKPHGESGVLRELRAQRLTLAKLVAELKI